jgi:alcohol dehydrogenase class IV
MTFDFFNVPRIVFARGAIARIGEFIPASARAFLVYNGRKRDLPRVVADFHQRGEPTVDDVDRALSLARDANCDFVLALGGGSAIDAGKAVAGLLANGGAATDYMEVVGKGQKITRPAVPWIAIPTTAGTGAEVTRNAVIDWPEKKFKASIRSELLMAKVALIDPELHVDVPPEVTARSGMDALCQCVEAHVSRGANPLTDALALQGVKLAVRNLGVAVRRGDDLTAREGMALAALLSGIALANAGLGAVHGFAAPLGARFPVPHGTVCGLLLPHVNYANIVEVLKNPWASDARARYVEIGRALLLDPAATEASALDAAVAVPRALCDELRLPPLREFGVSEADLPDLVSLARQASSMRYTPVTLDDATLAAILRAAL